MEVVVERGYVSSVSFFLSFLVFVRSRVMGWMAGGREIG